MKPTDLLNINPRPGDKPNSVSKTTVAQVFRDIAALKNTSATEALNALIETLSEQDIKDIQTIFDRHRFPDKSIRFHRLSNYNNYILSGLSAAAQSVLLLLIRTMSQDNYVAVPVPVICREASVTEKTCRQALLQLRHAGVIAQITAAVRHMPAVYIVDPRLCAAGKVASYADITLFLDAREKDAEYKRASTTDALTTQYQHTITHIKDDEGTRKRGIGQLIEKTKGSASATDTSKPKDK